MAARKTVIVDWAGGVCVREAPTKDSKVLEVLPCGAKATVNAKVEAPAGWLAVNGGFTMRQYLK